MLLAREREKPFGHGATLLRLRGGIVQESIPQSLAAAVKRGEVAGEVVGRYAAALAKLPHNFRWILRFEIIWRRMLADEDLFLKMSTEALMGCSMQAVAEIQQRGGAFLQQLDLVSADLFIVMIQCLACVVYAAPVVQTHDEDRGALGRFLSGCPSSVFGKRPNQDAPPFSALQRLFAYLKPMPALFIIGSGASVCGYVYSSLLLQLRFFLSTLKKMVRSRIRFSGQKGKTSYR
ncbi:hypothetical protein GUITHDRAFT_106975 [Guillardia theta CCMP2712]|uniref:Uncharacterized protein n=1 Tax=Guillardia theta (strain CCMP2712) TaxID=905079 RepID=L1JG34_GUITC|nr:hypothetical protein GUITHDRAFT_106975 [Guillardia theta CCMP2712]EKX47060.1 hypothetical protein GUITHDRAFT_106975 [Guillardia theta CCMP2712]|eukprot:XP_005834040.1 hypothetical protein GUITHDRAFT_106975 [Guillardia theta CCMP2712]